MQITWRRGPEAGAWSVAAFETTACEVAATRQPLFRDVTAQMLTEHARKRAQRSLRDEGLVAWVDAVRGDEAALRDSVEGILTALGDGTFHFDMSHVAVVDFDGDGLDDVFVAPSNAPAMVLRNTEDGFVEVAERLGLDFDRVHGAVFADFDNDGDSDAMLSFYERGTRYLRNAGGVFEPCDELVGGGLPAWVLAFNAVDYDQDGLLDVYLSRYNGLHLPVMAARQEREESDPGAVPESFRYPGMGAAESRATARLLFADEADAVTNMPGPPNLLYRNLGGGRFERAREVDAVEVRYQTMSAVWSDYDRDGDPDLYVTNEAGPNQLIRNDGRGRFVDVTDAATADVGYGMGAAWGDYDGDGRQDLYVTNMFSKAGVRITEGMDSSPRVAKAANGNTLLRNTPEGFVRVSGRGPSDIHVEAADFGWGGAFGDFDNDGALDLYVPAGYITMPAEAARPGDC